MRRKDVFSAIVAATLFCSPAAYCAEPSPAIVAKLADRQQQITAHWRSEIEGLRSELKKAAAADTNKEITDKKSKNLESSISKLQAAIKKNKNQSKDVTSTTKALDKEQSKLKDLTANRDRVKQLSDQLNHAQDALRKAESDGVPRTPLPVSTLEPVSIGQFGTLSRFSVKVLQVLDEGRMLISVSGGLQNPHPTTFLLMAPTKGLTDDAGLPMRGDQLFVATDTYKYGTVNGGTKTVMVLEEIDANAIRDAVAKKH